MDEGRSHPILPVSISVSKILYPLKLKAVKPSALLRVASCILSTDMFVDVVTILFSKVNFVDFFAYLIFFY